MIDEGYRQALEMKAASSKRCANLLSMTERLEFEIRVELHQHLTRDLLCDILEWKMARGKWRPRLRQLVSSNKDIDIENAWQEARDMVDKKVGFIAPVKRLAQLKGVGPGLASLLLSIVYPEQYAYFDEDAAMQLNGGRTLKFTFSEYESFIISLKKIREASATLEGASRDLWIKSIIKEQ